MKRANRLTALLTACLLLAGCTAAPQSVSLPARSSAPAQSSTRSAGANPDLAGLELQVLPEMSAVTAEGLYTVDMLPLPDGSIRILYGDFASSSLHPLCSLPGCDHTVVKATRPLYGLIDTADYWSSSPDYQALTYSD